MIASADYYHDLMQVAAQQGQCLVELVQDSRYVAGLVEANLEAEAEAEEEEEEEEEEEDPESESTVEPPQAKHQRQLPWE
jgi:hypothetical protein